MTEYSLNYVVCNFMMSKCNTTYFTGRIFFKGLSHHPAYQQTRFTHRVSHRQHSLYSDSVRKFTMLTRKTSTFTGHIISCQITRTNQCPQHSNARAIPYSVHNVALSRHARTRVHGLRFTSPVCVGVPCRRRLSGPRPSAAHRHSPHAGVGRARVPADGGEVAPRVPRDALDRRDGQLLYDGSWR